MPTRLSASSINLLPSVSIVSSHVFLIDVHRCPFVLEKLSLHSLCKQRDYIDAIILLLLRSSVAINPALPCFENVSLRVLHSNFTDFSKFSVCPSNKHCPSARCAYAANAVVKYLDIFAIGAVSFNHILQSST
jgi:hypothetical protein